MMLTRRSLLPVLAAIPFRRDNSYQTAIPRTKETRLVLGGDAMQARFVGRLARARHDPSYPFRDLAPVLAAADIAFVNLEAPFSDRGNPLEEGMVFKAEPAMISALELAGIDIVSTANNHARDCGSHGVEFTLDWLEKHGIACVGSGRSAEAAHAGAVITRNGTRFAFLAYTYDQANGIHTDVDERIAVIDTQAMQRDVARILTRADVAIVSMHAGFEYASRPNHQQIEFAHAAVAAGARIVVGHHPHVVQHWKRQGDAVVFYSLGNLVFDQFQRAETQHGALAEIVFSGTAIMHADMIPIDIVGTVPRLGSSTRDAVRAVGRAAGAG